MTLFAFGVLARIDTSTIGVAFVLNYTNMPTNYTKSIVFTLRNLIQQNNYRLLES